MKPYLIIIIILSIIIILFFTVLFIIYKMAFYNDNKKKQKFMIDFNNEQYAPYKDYMLKLIDEALKLPYEEIKIKSHDNKKLAAKYYHFCDNAPIDVLFHGYKGNSIKDYSGGIQISKRNNHNVLLIDQRSHGKSDGYTISFGIKERFDVLSWVNYVNMRFGNYTPITLIGISMGAATVLMASNLNFPKNVVAIHADCPYSSPQEMILLVARKMHVNTKIIKPFLYLSALLIGKFKINEIDAIKAVKESKIPILLIHGTDDRLVPHYMSEQIAKANPKITFYSFDKAAHGISFISDPLRYEEITKDFINKQITEFNNNF